MLSAVSRATAGVLRVAKPALNPQLVQNEAAKLVGAVSVNRKCETLVKTCFLKPQTVCSSSAPWHPWPETLRCTGLGIIRYFVRYRFVSMPIPSDSRDYERCLAYFSCISLNGTVLTED